MFVIAPLKLHVSQVKDCVEVRVRVVVRVNVGIGLGLGLGLDFRMPLFAMAPLKLPVSPPLRSWTFICLWL